MTRRTKPHVMPNDIQGLDSFATRQFGGKLNALEGNTMRKVGVNFAIPMLRSQDNERGIPVSCLPASSEYCSATERSRNDVSGLFTEPFS